MHRRHLLSLGLLQTARLLVASSTEAMRRTPYGGALRLTLPFRLNSIDPHDPEDLSAAFFGVSLFEPLFSKTSRGQVYPTLAASPAISENGGLLIRLREGLKFSHGGALTAKDVVASIRRSKKLSSALVAVPQPTFSRHQPLLVRFASGNSTRLMQALASPRSAILPENYSPLSPISCGALQVESMGQTLRLRRNPLAPRGGSYFDTVVLQRGSITESLRAFEATSSDLGFLGSGLHQPRAASVSFKLGALGQVVLIPGPRIRTGLTPGVLHSHLAQLRSAPFSALGTWRVRTAPREWKGPPFSILVSTDEPWLNELAQELSHAWTSPGTKVVVEADSHANFLRRRKSGDYDAVMTAIASANLPPQVTAADLFQLEQRAPPRGGRALSPDQVARQLRLGILGELRPRGATRAALTNLTDGSTLNFATGYDDSPRR